MNRLIIMLCGLLVVFMPLPAASGSEDNAGSDTEAVEKLFFVRFEKGPSWNDSLKPQEQPGFAEHSANLGQLRREGRIAFGARYEDYGMIFLRAGNKEAAMELLADDPGVKSGIFVFHLAELRPFYSWKE